MGLFGFGNPNKKVEKTIKKLKAAGYSENAYKSRKCCENCKYRSANGMCKCDGHIHRPSDVCSRWFGK